MKRVFCLFLSILMLCTLTIPAFAEETAETPSSEAPTAPPAPTQCAHSWDAGSGTDATCTAAGSKTYTCTLCGITKTENPPAKGHSFGGWAQTDASSHKRSCTACGAEESGSHSMSTAVTKEATCVDKGIKTHSCSGCGYSYTEEVAATGTHTYTAWTATAEGHTCSCTVCGKVVTGAHESNGSDVITPATCKEEGLWKSRCGICNYEMSKVIPKRTDHTYDSICDPDCNVCGLTRQVEHKLIPGWSKNASGHWRVCSNAGCKLQLEFGKHYPGPAATESAPQVCLTCNYTLTPQLNHEHTYTETWSSDESGHWYPCSGCEDQKDHMPHEYDGLCDSDCNVCGFENDNAHSFDGSWHSDEDGHWFVCMTCGSVVEAKDHIAPEMTPEGEAVCCLSCGYQMAEAVGHTHVFAETWNSDDSQHWRECSCGTASESATHNWGAGEKDQNGDTVFTCSVCGASHIQEAPADQDTEEFPWMIVFIVLVVALLSAIVALVMVLKPRKPKSFK